LNIKFKVEYLYTLFNHCISLLLKSFVILLSLLTEPVINLSFDPHPHPGKHGDWTFVDPDARKCPTYGCNQSD
jgi:hypothetical protein